MEVVIVSSVVDTNGSSDRVLCVTQMEVVTVSSVVDTNESGGRVPCCGH
jgi:hypothetical protein